MGLSSSRYFQMRPRSVSLSDNAIAGSTGFDFKPPSLDASRSPCPALNTLANHGYIPRSGRNIRFWEVVEAINIVYNLTYPLCIFLASVGFITSGRARFRYRRDSDGELDSRKQPVLDNQPIWKSCVAQGLRLLSQLAGLLPLQCVLDLSSLSKRGLSKITHNASFVHPDNIPSTCPDYALLKRLLAYPLRKQPYSSGTLTRHLDGSLNLADIAHYHALRMDASCPKPDSLHTQVALGECALLFLVMRQHVLPGDGLIGGSVSRRTLERWFGEERLPEGWWVNGGLRPKETIGLLEARGTAALVDELARGNMKMPTVRCQ